MVFICTTRFNAETLQQNCIWRRRQQRMHQCVYGSPNAMKQTIRENAWMIVLEMHNDINKIAGIGLVRNSPNLSQDSEKGVVIKPHVYKCGNYNRFIYQGAYRIDLLNNDADTLIALTLEEQLVIKMLELALFRGPNHSKRGKGICELPKHVACLYDFKECLKGLVQRFVKTFRGRAAGDMLQGTCCPL
jgi:hypothetical protein